MVRTVISLEEDDKAWLEEKARQEGVPMTEMVRRAVRHLRTSEVTDSASTVSLLVSTAGILDWEDGLEAQRQLRDEWQS